MSTVAAELLQVGDRAVVTATFTVAGVPPGARPAAAWEVWPPGVTIPTVYASGVAAEATPVAGDVGGFQLSLPCTAAGEWAARCTVTGAAEGAVQGRWYVEGPPR